MGSFRIEDPKAVESFLDKLDEARKPIDKSTATKVGRTIVREMKKLISRGRSPIAGRGNFPGYRGSYRKAIKDRRISGKSLSPVNLKLSGRFLRSLGFKTFKSNKRGWVTRIGFVGPGSRSRSALLEQGHREGANDQAERPIIPDAELNENFRRDIVAKIRSIFEERINEIVRKK